MNWHEIASKIGFCFAMLMIVDKYCQILGLDTNSGDSDAFICEDFRYWGKFLRNTHRHGSWKQVQVSQQQQSILRGKKSRKSWSDQILKGNPVIFTLHKQDLSILRRTLCNTLHQEGGSGIVIRLTAAYEWKQERLIDNYDESGLGKYIHVISHHVCP